ncbi:MAG: DUF1566 domain-containing protein [Pseudomonadota bacterium]
MERKQQRGDGWRPRHGRRQRDMGRISGLFLGILFFSLAVPAAHAVGPYRAGNQAVVDQGTGLMWQKGDDAISRDWQSALAYCEDLTLLSKSDWRLPSIRELKSLVDDSRYYPAIDPAFRSHSSSYWSATSVTGQPVGNAWVVNFSNGDDNWYLKTARYRVRCVRGGVTKQ